MLSAGFLREIGYVRDQMDGDIDFGGTVFWDADAWGLQGAVASSSLRVLNFPLRRLQGVLNGDRESMELEVQSAEYADGSLSGSVRVDFEPGEPPAVAIDLELEAGRLRAAPRRPGLAGGWGRGLRLGAVQLRASVGGSPIAAPAGPPSR